MEYDANAKDFIEEQFRLNGVSFSLRSNDFSVYCPFSSHENNKKLLQVRFDGKMIHCWGCGARGHFNTLADKIGLRRLPASIDSGYGAVDQALQTAFLEQGVPALPNGIKPFRKEWRGLSSEFLQRFESYHWYDVESLVWRVLWPLKHNGKLQGYTAGRIDNETIPKYRHGPKGVIQTRRVLFPIDDKSIQDTVVLVEGPFSALRLINEGIPALATLGADNWHSAKITMMLQRKPSIKGIIIAFDADVSGERGADKVFESTQSAFQRVERFDCPLRVKKVENAEGKMVPELDRKGNKVLVGTDPGDMPSSYVEKLRALFKDVQSSVQPRKKIKG